MAVAGAHEGALGPLVVTGRPRTAVTDLWEALKHNPPSAISFGFLVLIVASAVLAQVIAPYNPEASTRGAALLSPRPDHLFGTDNLGRDLF